MFLGGEKVGIYSDKNRFLISGLSYHCVVMSFFLGDLQVLFDFMRITLCEANFQNRNFVRLV